MAGYESDFKTCIRQSRDCGSDLESHSQKQIPVRDSTLTTGLHPARRNAVLGGKHGRNSDSHQCQNLTAKYPTGRVNQRPIVTREFPRRKNAEEKRPRASQSRQSQDIRLPRIEINDLPNKNESHKEQQRYMYPNSRSYRTHTTNYRKSKEEKKMPPQRFLVPLNIGSRRQRYLHNRDLSCAEKSSSACVYADHDQMVDGNYTSSKTHKPFQKATETVATDFVTNLKGKAVKGNTRQKCTLKPHQNQAPIARQEMTSLNSSSCNKACTLRRSNKQNTSHQSRRQGAFHSRLPMFVLDEERFTIPKKASLYNFKEFLEISESDPKAISSPFPEKKNKYS